MSFYGSKMILDRPNYFGWVWIILDGSNSFWSGPNHFGQVQIIKISPEKSNLNLTKMIWTQPKWIGPVQNDLYSTKMIWTVQNHFGPIEGQGSSQFHRKFRPFLSSSHKSARWGLSCSGEYFRIHAIIVKLASILASWKCKKHVKINYLDIFLVPFY